MEFIVQERIKQNFVGVQKVHFNFLIFKAAYFKKNTSTKKQGLVVHLIAIFMSGISHYIVSKLHLSKDI